MKYRIISVGKIREPFYQNGINEYIKRLKVYTSVELVDGLEEKISPRAGEKDIQKVLQKEADKILKLLNKDEMLVVLDSRGRSISSEKFAEYIADWNISNKSRINLIIGGSFGLADKLKKEANMSISFSKMTFPHQMAVLILSEQIYRGFKILRGEPYHK